MVYLLEQLLILWHHLNIQQCDDIVIFDKPPVISLEESKLYIVYNKDQVIGGLEIRKETNLVNVSPSLKQGSVTCSKYCHLFSSFTNNYLFLP